MPPRAPHPSTLAHPVLRSLAALAALGGACVLYGVLVEPRWYRLQRYRLPVLPPASGPLTVLHLSDLHLRARDPAKVRFLTSLPRPDLAVVTGDLLGEPEAAEAVAAALHPLRGRLASYFVLGSNDYYVPRPLNYAAYFRRRRRRRRGVRSRHADLVRLLEADGWVHLRNRRTLLPAYGVRLEVLGLDDPHIERHDLRAALREDPEALGLAVVHAPDPAPELAALGYRVILAGHTHGGQVRLPLVGALVTNSTVPRRLAMGLARVGPALLHVSPGLGTSKYAPFRFLCRPEATLLELVAGPGPSLGDRALQRTATASS
ncbi:MAG TPA: metallophosphoesterase [Actinomycetota bacterium]|nr:metallophosphoesterase [Actinomycetota bacterium]